MRDYYVKGLGWFVCRAKNKRIARKAGVEEFGSGNINEVREATKGEVESYLFQKGLKEIPVED